jgi:hypothetical protein
MNCPFYEVARGVRNGTSEIHCLARCNRGVSDSACAYVFQSYVAYLEALISARPAEKLNLAHIEKGAAIRHRKGK